MRAQIQEAERRGDFAELALLTQRKLELDRALRQLRGSGLTWKLTAQTADFFESL